MSPNKPAITKHIFAIQLTERLYRKVEKQAQLLDLSLGAYISSILDNVLQHIELSDEDEQIILNRMQKNLDRRAKKGRK